MHAAWSNVLVCCKVLYAPTNVEDIALYLSSLLLLLLFLLSVAVVV